jgi:ribosomal protein S21
MTASIKITKKEGESSDRVLKRFSGRIKSLKLSQIFRKLRYFKQKPTKTKVRQAAVIREAHRANNRKKFFLT